MQYGTFEAVATSSGDGLNTPWLWHGRHGVWTDKHTGMHQMRARWYSSALRRFLNPDPAGFAGGSNFYLYANGDPVSMIDPFGLCGGKASEGPGMMRIGASIGVGFIPGVGSAQSLVELFTGQDYITGEPANRWLAAVGLIPFAKGAIKAGGRLFSHADDVAKLAGRADGIAGSALKVNPTRGTENCVNVALALNSKLAGHAASAMPGGLTSIKLIEDAVGMGKKFDIVSGPMEIGSILSKAGNGATGIVYGAGKGGDPGHVWNVIFQDGTVRFLDGQTGKVGGEALGNFGNFLNFEFLLTRPGK